MQIKNIKHRLKKADQLVISLRHYTIQLGFYNYIDTFTILMVSKLNVTLDVPMFHSKQITMILTNIQSI